MANRKSEKSVYNNIDSILRQSGEYSWSIYHSKLLENILICFLLLIIFISAAESDRGIDWVFCVRILPSFCYSGIRFSYLFNFNYLIYFSSLFCFKFILCLF